MPGHRLIRKLIFGVLLVASAALHAEPLVVPMGYIQWVPDQGPVLSNVIPKPADSGLRGAELATADNNTTGRFLDQNYQMTTSVADSEEGVLASFDRMLADGVRLFVFRVPAKTLTALSKRARPDVLMFNAGARDDGLRLRDCAPSLLHTIPSYAMLTDALGQWLNQRRWNEVFLISGPTAEDKAWAAAFHRSARRFGLDIVEDKPWTFDADLRRSASRELPLFTQADDYDVVVVADVRGDFGEYVPFHTWLPRPVVGTQGMTPVAWHRVVESWGATQLQNRFRELAQRNMNSEDYAAWAAVRAIGTAVTETGSAEVKTLRSFLFSDQFQLAGFKGRKLTFRTWNGQLRQPIPLVHPRGLVDRAPFEGFLHPRSRMDTLGFDRPESECRING